QLPWFLREALQEGRWDIRPTGGLFLRRWFEHALIEDQRLPTDLILCRFWDLAATSSQAGSDPDHTAGVLLGRSKEGGLYVLDATRAQASDLEVRELIARVAQSDRDLARAKGWRDPAIRIEQEPGAAGTYLIG